MKTFLTYAPIQTRSREELDSSPLEPRDTAKHHGQLQREYSRWLLDSQRNPGIALDALGEYENATARLDEVVTPISSGRVICCRNARAKLATLDGMSLALTPCPSPGERGAGVLLHRLARKLGAS
jgi:hypothetical protein